MLKLNRGLIVLVAVTILSVVCCAATMKPFAKGEIDHSERDATEAALMKEVQQLLIAAASAPAGPMPDKVSAAHPWLKPAGWELMQEAGQEHGYEYSMQLVANFVPERNWIEYDIVVSFADGASFYCWTYPAAQLQGCARYE